VDDEKIADELTLLEQLAADVPRVLLSDVEMPENIVSAFQRRISGYVPTTLPIRQVAEAIRYVIAGGIFVPSSILSLSDHRVLPSKQEVELNPSTILANFSPRQNEVLRRLWRGSSNKMIAYELNMCESTVKVHIRHIMKKLKVSNRTQVVLHTRPLLLEDRQPADMQGQGRQPRSPDAAVGLTAMQSAVRPNGGLVADTQDSRLRRNGSHHT
jgi:DNA-binding NarL/FixJ family response regulator